MGDEDGHILTEWRKRLWFFSSHEDERICIAEMQCCGGLDLQIESSDGVLLNLDQCERDGVDFMAYNMAYKAKWALRVDLF